MLGHILLFWKVTMQTFQKTPNFQWIFPLKKKFGGALTFMRGAAEIWAMHIFSSTYFDEISIFGLSKDQTFRIWSTFMNLEQFLILVPYLIIIQNWKLHFVFGCEYNIIQCLIRIEWFEPVSLINFAHQIKF